MTSSARPMIHAVLFGQAGGFGLSQLLQMPTVLETGTPILTGSTKAPEKIQNTQLSTSLSPPADPGSDGLVRARATTESSSRVSDAVIDSALVQPTSTQPQTGDFWLEAFVLDESGQPLPGATVTARPSRNYDGVHQTLGGPAPAHLDPRSRLRKTAELIAMERANLRSGMTDSAGRVRFEGIPKTTWTINAYLEGFLIKQSPAHAAVHSNSRVNFNAQPTPSLSITVLAPDGTPTEEAIIEAKTPYRENQSGREVLYRWSQNEPFRLSEGSYTLRALSQEQLPETEKMRFSRLGSEAVQLEVIAGQAPAPLTLQLVPRTGICGRILQADGAPAMEDTRVHMLLLAPGQVPSPDLLKGEDAKRINTRSGTFKILDIEPGTYLLGLSLRRNRTYLTTATVTLETGVLESDLVIPDLGPDGTLQITTLAPTGRRINVDALRLKVTKPGGSSNTNIIQPRRKSTGVYLLRKPDFMRNEATPDSTYAINATDSRYGSCWVNFAKGTNEVELRFIEPASLEVTITGFTGHKFADRLTLTVKTRSERNSSSLNRDKKVGETGSCLFKGLEPGVNQISLGLQPQGSQDRFWSSSSTIARLDLTLEKGANYAQIHIPTLFSLSVLAPGIREGLAVTVRPTRENSSGDDSQPRTRYKRARFNESGQATLNEILPGSYRVQADGFQEARVEVPCGEVKLEPAEPKKDG